MRIKIPGYSREVDISEKIDGTEHFNWGEVTHKGQRLWSQEALTWNAVHQARALDELRKKLDVSFRVTSWYRSPRYNRSIGGAPNSLHTTNHATDVIITGLSSTRHNADKIRELGWTGGIGYYPNGGWFHLSTHPTKEKGVTFNGG